MNLEGVVAKKDVDGGVENFIKGAAKNNAYCYYYLSMLHHEGQLIQRNPKLEFLYLKRAAKEGYVHMQHLLGIAYYEGRLVKKNDKLALAWLRESARNGYKPSYQLAGDILFHGTSEELKKILPKSHWVQK
jgi:TPR repeat protein